MNVAVFQPRVVFPPGVCVRFSQVLCVCVCVLFHPGVVCECVSSRCCVCVFQPGVCRGHPEDSGADEQTETAGERHGDWFLQDPPGRFTQTLSLCNWSSAFISPDVIFSTGETY